MNNSEITDGLRKAIKLLGTHTYYWYMCNVLRVYKIERKDLPEFRFTNFKKFIKTNYPELERSLAFNPSRYAPWIGGPFRRPVQAKKIINAKKAFLQSILDKYETAENNFVLQEPSK